MSETPENNFAYIDGANLYKGVADLGWKLDYKRFRIWLKDKYRVVDFYENKFDNAILVSSDGDYAGLVKFLKEKERFRAILSPAIAKKCSILLKRTEVEIAYINDQRMLLEALKRKSPR